jgi:hypothetical protein
VLIAVGAVLMLVGLLVQVGLPLGRLPGDIRVQRGNSTFYFPIVTCIVVSVVLSVIGMLWRR